MDEAQVLLLVGVLLSVSIIIAGATSRYGVPALVAFLAIGMGLGAENLGGISFENAEVARIVGVAGLTAILFEGGLSTSWRRLRQVALPAFMLSTTGVLITAFLTGLASYNLLDLSLLESFLLGAVVSSTDAAAVFATLRFTSIRRKLARTLEAETGGNDPVAIALTIGLITWIESASYNAGNLALLMLQQLGLGLVVGVLLSFMAMWIFSRLPHTIGAFAPVASLAAAALAFGVAGSVGGSGFLSVYLVGLAIGSTPSRYRSQLVAFHEGIAFLAQVAMFIVLGLLVVPSDLVPVAIPGIILAALLLFIIRPFAVWVSTYFSQFTTNEKLLLGWAGLRGAVPIVLGTFALSEDINNSETIFHVVFFIVLVSALVQGTTLEKVAKKLGVVEADTEDSEAIRARQDDLKERIEFLVMSQHSIAGATVSEVGLPKQAQIKKIVRGTKSIKPDPKSVIRPGDCIVVVVPVLLRPELEDVFTRWRRRI